MRLEILRLTNEGMKVVGHITVEADDWMSSDDLAGQRVLAQNPGATAMSLVKRYNGGYLMIVPEFRYGNDKFQAGKFTFEKYVGDGKRLYIYQMDERYGDLPYDLPALPSTVWDAGLVASPGQLARLALGELVGRTDGITGIESTTGQCYVSVHDDYAFFSFRSDNVEGSEYTTCYRLPVAELNAFITAWEVNCQADFPDPDTDFRWRVCTGKATIKAVAIECVAAVMSELNDPVIHTRIGPIPAHPMVTLNVIIEGNFSVAIEETSTQSIVNALMAMDSLAQTTLSPGVSLVEWTLDQVILTFDGRQITVTMRHIATKQPLTLPADQVSGFVDAALEVMSRIGNEYCRLNPFVEES